MKEYILVLIILGLLSIERLKEKVKKDYRSPLSEIFSFFAFFGTEEKKMTQLADGIREGISANHEN